VWLSSASYQQLTRLSVSTCANLPIPEISSETEAVIWTFSIAAFRISITRVDALWTFVDIWKTKISYLLSFIFWKSFCVTLPSQKLSWSGNILKVLVSSLTNIPVLENVRQRQQHRCQEIFDKISSQEIFLHLAGNSCHLINRNAILYK
jgi:hypothetical protein